MFLLHLDEDSRKPKYQQILEGLRRAIENRSLRPGDRLPSTRRLAERLCIHRSTVSLAYQELWSQGFLDLRAGTCARVRDRVPVATASNRAQRGRINWSAVSSETSQGVVDSYRRFYSSTSPRDTISFRSLDMDRRLFPLENLRSCLAHVSRKHGAKLMGYGDHAGFPPLRESLARRLQSHSISVTADEILITNGAQQGIDLVLRMIAAAGRSVAIESPTYGHVLPLLRLSGLRPLEIPIRSDGMDLSLLEKTVRNGTPSLVYTMPTFQNPTGVTTDQAHRESLLSICERSGVPILEDGFEEEMKYFGKVVLPIKSMDKSHVVIYCGTFSKVVSPGVRVGWIAADRQCIERLVALRCFSDLSPNLILQAAMDEFCRRGYYDRHINKMHRVFRKRMQTAIQALRDHIDPEWAEWAEPTGGYLFWFRLKPASISPPNLEKLLVSHGVEVAHGRGFFHTGPKDTHLRLSISTLAEEEIVEGVRRLSRVLGHVYRRNRR